MLTKRVSRAWVQGAAGGAVVLLGLYAASTYSYVLFHTVAEIFSIVVSCAVFILAFNTRRYLAGDYLPFVGLALLSGSAFNLLHLLTYQGMSVVEGVSSNVPTQLWIARRYLESVALLFAPLLLGRRLDMRLAFLGFGGVVALAVLAIASGTFPAAYVPGTGLTPFKVVSEYVIAGIFLAAAIRMYMRRSEFEGETWIALLAALGVGAFSELLFTLYAGVYDLPNLLGHFATIVSSYLIYRAIVKTGLIRPYDLLAQANTALRGEIGERQRAEASLAQHDRWLQSLHRIDRAILDAQSVAGTAQVAVNHLRRLAGCSRTSVVLFDFAAHSGEILAVSSEQNTETGVGQRIPLETFRITDESWPAYNEEVVDLRAQAERTPIQQQIYGDGVRYYLSLPLLVRGKLIGAMNLGASDLETLSPGVREIARQVADSVAVAIDNARLAEEVQHGRGQLQVLSRRLVEIQESERQHVARILHDDVGQQLAALKIGLLLLSRQVGCSEEMAAQIDDLRQLTNHAIRDVHDLGAEARSVSLEHAGIAVAVREYVETFRHKSGIAVVFEADSLQGQRLPADVELTLYRVVQEALRNVQQHAKANRARVCLHRVDSQVEAVIEDDGVGFDPHSALRESRLGLFGMQERIDMLHGTLDVESAPSRGTRLIIKLPCGSGAVPPLMLSR